ncbi:MULTISPECIES: polyphosphate:AMP phosphotransferase [unclassified Stappia]|uniref:polyphosphate:AMP phosphotransferase n=1 Tax=unclassified Stappia TaxID=2629676 RepID=UPI001643BBA3|nr:MULTISPECIES: polyphosphate:AMP phosphotransferase [unclassified Stappia]
MFQSASLPVDLSRTDFDALEPKLRTELLAAQLEVIEKKPFSVLIVIAGVDGAGKNDAIARLHEWLDVRYVTCNAYDEATDEERGRPDLWRYWRDLPALGETSIVVSSWYNEPLRCFVQGEIGEAEFERRLARINRFEGLLARENVLVLKFWFSLTPAMQKRRLKGLGRKGRARRILAEWTDIAHASGAQAAFEQAALATSTPIAPWIVIPSDEPRARDLALGRCVEMAIRRRLEAAPADPLALPAVVARVERRSAVEAVDLGARLSNHRYRTELDRLQDELARLVDRKAFRDRSLVVAFEGNDAAGKGGAIRRLIRPLDPRRYRVHRIAAPSQEEHAHPWLWRFWNRLPRRGHAAVFDRSWYGRVLVERVEGFCSEAAWSRAYNEINEFEAELADAGAIVVKFWLAISRQEQLARFKEREEVPYKQFKLTDDDWRNRLKWDHYAEAAGDMVDRTSTRLAPWHLVAAEDKRFARVEMLRQLVGRLEQAL